MLDTINDNKYISINIQIKSLSPLYLFFDRVDNGAAWVEKYCDDLGIPYISPSMIIKMFTRLACQRLEHYDSRKKDKTLKLIEDMLTLIKKDKIIYVNSALIKSYKCIRNALMFLDKKEMLSKKQVCNIFAEKTDVEYEGVLHHTRVIKTGTEFSTFVNIDKKYADLVLDILNGEADIEYPFDLNSKLSIKADIQGEIVSADWIKFKMPEIRALKNDKDDEDYRLYYSVENMSELICWGSLYYADNSSNCIPGFYMHELVDNIYKHLENTNIPNNIIFSNAYPSINDKRGIVAPKSFLVDKLDKSKLRDRTYSLPVRSQKGEFEQLKSLDKCIVSSLNDDHVYSVEEKINSRVVEYIDGPINDSNDALNAEKVNVFGLSLNQKFRGFIQGPLDQIEKIAQDITAFRHVCIGLFCGQGFGRAKLEFHKLESVAATSEQLTNEFVIKTSSSVLLYDTHGNETVKSEDLLHAVESKIGAIGDLEAIVINSGVELIFPGSPEMEHRPRTWEAIEAGSVYYVKTKSGKKIDIAKFSKIWIGEYNNWGYGEVDIYLTKKNYYKTLEEIDSTFSEIIFPLSYREVLQSKKFIQFFTDEYLKNTVLRLAKIDASQCRFNKKDEGAKKVDVPKSIIKWIKDHFEGSIDDDDLFKIYEKNFLEEV